MLDTRHVDERYLPSACLLSSLSLCFSPVGEWFRVRARRFPGLINLTVIDQFHPWPKEALESVARRFIGELEISDLNQIYLENNSLNVEILDTGTAWLDTGTFESLYEAGSLIKTLDNRQGLKIGYPEEVAWRMGWINNRDLGLLAKRYKQNEYGQYLLELVGFKD